MTFPTVELVAVRRTVSAETISQGPQPRLARMVIVGEGVDDIPIFVPYAPIRVSHGNLGGSYNLINRPGLADATVFDSPKVPNMSFDLLLLDKTPGAGRAPFASTSATAAVAIINALKSYSEKGKRVRITYGSLESGLWYIDDISATSLKRDPQTDEILQAGCTLSLTRAEDIIEGLGPVTGGATTPPPTAPPPPQQTSARYYTVKSGDTLWAISIKFYGTGTRWTEIADANGVKDPKTLQVGKVLRIP